MKNILLLTDLSANALNAIQYAFQLFKKTDCKFYLLNVQKTSTYVTADLLNASANESLYDHIITDHKKQLDEIITTLKPSATVVPLVAFEDFTIAIEKTIATYEIDLLVMGTNGATGAKEVIFGSNTLQVIRNLNCSVIAVPEGYMYKEVKHAMFCVDKRKDFHTAQIKPLLALLKIHQPKLHIVKMDIELSENEPFLNNTNEGLLQKFNEFSCEFHEVNQLPAWMVLQTGTQLLNIDLNAIFIEKESFLERLWTGSEMSEIAYSSRVPLLFLSSTVA